ncbi:hypothetical protein [Lysobacter enzymogenes]|uniref:hypothetical protein n=1 Tax=Lysobacter enzymogenes TaxID=69 RepID=UPI001AF6298D|nr:hypothetical protein [Lysobacter enzymogenes]QQQ00945.1 hypothetical protein JHW41_23240 [Lysobacter enzymogenes]
MTDPIEDFIVQYRHRREEHLEEQRRFRRQRKNSKLTELDLISQDEDFYAKCLSELAGFARLRGKELSITRTTGLVLALKNKAEIINADIDFLNYLHTLIAIALPLFIIAGQFNRDNYWAALACVFFVIMVFVKRAKLRKELSIAKELTNLFDQTAKGSGSASK